MSYGIHFRFCLLDYQQKLWVAYSKLIGYAGRNYRSQLHYICTILGMMVSKSRLVETARKSSPELLKNYADYFQKMKVSVNIHLTLYLNK